jgi:hypothetical protein
MGGVYQGLSPHASVVMRLLVSIPYLWRIAPSPNAPCTNNKAVHDNVIFMLSPPNFTGLPKLAPPMATRARSCMPPYYYNLQDRESSTLFTPTAVMLERSKKNWIGLQLPIFNYRLIMDKITKLI